VIVIGGGFAGLSAATALAEAQVPVTLVEARPTLGGRANTFRDPWTGERIDNGQHLLAGAYVETLAFLRRIGASAGLHRPSTLRVAMIDEHRRRTDLQLPPLSSPINLLAGLWTWDALTLADRWSMLRIGAALQGRRRVAPDETVRQWLERYGQSPRLCRLLWEPLALAALNQPLEVAAASAFVAVTSRLFGTQPDAATLLVPALPLADLYVGPATRFLEQAGGRVITHGKGQVVFEGSRLSGVRVRGETIPSTCVISAVPWFALEATLLLPPSTLAQTVRNAASLGSAPIVNVNLWLDDYGAPAPFFGLPGRVFQWVFDCRQLMSLGNPPRATHVTLVSSGAEAICNKSNDELIAAAFRELCEATATGAPRLRHAAVVRERRATFSLAPGGPPRPATVSPVPGLFLAGDWIETGLPATIESAVASGHAAAREALHHERSEFTRE
jgi:squalene-associated FAD-dependent desaturase